jgi:hypothetical protein
MLVVMLIILIVTATAMFAVHSTMFELRAAGSQRQAMQTQMISEGTLITALAMIDDGLTPAAIDRGMQSVMIPAGTQWTPEEPAYTQATAHYRVYMSTFSTVPGVIAPSIETGGYGNSFGTTSGYTPNFIIDINDALDPGITIAGMSATGDSPVAYRMWTVTTRGRTEVGSTDPLLPGEPTTVPLQRRMHTTAMNSRAVVISGPIPRQ